MQHNVEVLSCGLEGIEQGGPLLRVFKVDLGVRFNQSLDYFDVAFLAGDHEGTLGILLVLGVDVSARVQKHLDALTDLVLLD